MRIGTLYSRDLRNWGCQLLGPETGSFPASVAPGCLGVLARGERTNLPAIGADRVARVVTVQAYLYFVSGEMSEVFEAPGSAGVFADRVSSLRGFVQWQAGESGLRDWGQRLHEHGHVWVGSGLPARMRRGYPKACFQNAWASARRSEHLVYCEGWAISGTLPVGLPMEHAWLVDTRPSSTAQ